MTFRYLLKEAFAHFNLINPNIFTYFSTFRTKLPVFGSEWERKILIATSNDREIPDSQDLIDIADATLDPAHFQEIMDKLWNRINQKPKDWKIIYKVITCFVFISDIVSFVSF